MKMKHNVWVVGTPGAGKSEVVRLLREKIEAETVGEEKAVLYEVSDLAHFDKLLDLMGEQPVAVLLLLDHRRAVAVQDLQDVVKKTWGEQGAAIKALAVGVTHTDSQQRRPLEIYSRWLEENARDLGGRAIPVMKCNTRSSADTHGLLLALISMAEIAHRFPRKKRAGV